MTSDLKQNHSYWLTKEEASVRFSSITSISYTLHLILHKESFEGSCSITFTSSSIESWLDLNGATITSLTLNSSEVPINYELSRVSLQNLNIGSNLVTVTYSREYSKDGYGLHKFEEPSGETYIYSNFEPFHAHKMFPCFDQPDLKATYSVSVRCRSSFKVLSNEPISQVTPLAESDESLTVFNRTSLFSTYLVALIAGDYHEHRFEGGRFPMGIYCRRSLQDQLVPERFFKWTVRGFEFYEKLFDIPYPFNKYDQVFVPEYNAGAMENVGCVTYSESYLKKKQSKTQLNLAAFTFLHEMAHMWFGNLVTMKWWDDLWLNESFATYLSYLAVDSCLHEDFQGSWMLFLRRKSFAYSADQKKTTHPISSHVENTSQTRSIFDSISYSKGAGVIKQIVFIMGLENFQLSVQEYLKAHVYSNTLFDDFIFHLSQRKPELKDWAKDWIQTSGVNFLYSEICGDEIRMEQKALGTCEKIKYHEFLFEAFDVDCRVCDSGRCVMEQERLVIKAKGSPACVVLNVEDQHYVKVIIDERSLGFIEENFFRIENPLTRMLIVTQLLEMVTSLVVSSERFVKILYDQFLHEDNEILANYILTTASSMLLSKVGDDAVKQEYYPKFFDAIISKLEMSQDFEDNILSFIYTDQQIEDAVKWLEGTSPIPLTQSRRWRLLKQYSRITIEAKRLVDQEADPSHEGKLARLFCESTYPDPEYKSKAWAQFMQGCPGLSRFERKSLMSGFMRKSQKSLLREYSKLYFKSIPKIKSDFNHEYLVDFCSILFPEFRTLKYLKFKVQKTLEVIGQDNKQLVKILNDKIENTEKNRLIKGKITNVE